MDDMTFPILANEPPALRVKPEDWMVANEAMLRLIPPALRRKSVEANPPVPVRFTLTDGDQDQKPA